MPIRCRILRWCMAAMLACAVAAPAHSEQGGDPPPGDIVTLSNGSQMTGVRVVRKTATNYKVEVVEGVVMDIPVSLVTHIEYDERMRARGRAGSSSGGTGATEDEIWAQEMAPALNKVLTQPLDEPLLIDDADLLVVMQVVSERFGIDIELSEEVEAIPMDERRWSVEIPSESTLLRLFRDELPARFPQLAAITQFDRIVITDRDGAESAEAPNNAEPAGEAPAAPG